MSNDENSMEWGKEEEVSSAPLTAQERRILEQAHGCMLKGVEKYNEVLNSLQGRDVSKEIKLSAKLSGDTLKKLLYLRHVVSEGAKGFTTSEMTKIIIETGIAFLYDRVTVSELAGLHTYMQLRELPEDIQEAAMNQAKRAKLRSFTQRYSDGALKLDLESLTGRGDAPPHGILSVPEAEDTDTSGALCCAKCSVVLGEKNHSHKGQKFCSDCFIDMQ